MKSAAMIGSERIKEILHAEKPRLEKEYAVSKLLLFGSFARGEQKRGSDIDILVGFSRSIDFFRFIDLETDLAEKLGRKVDLVTEGALKPQMKNRVLAEAVEVR